MKKQPVKKVRSRKSQKINFTLSKRNYQIFGLGILIIILGYTSLSKGPADSFWSLTLAPILLVIGYCVLVPLSIIYKDKVQQETTKTSK